MLHPQKRLFTIFGKTPPQKISAISYESWVSLYKIWITIKITEITKISIPNLKFSIIY